MKAQIDRKVRDGIYRFESIPCCICNGTDFEKLSEKDRYGLYAPVVICRACGLIQTNPRMDAASYNAFYNSEYRVLYSGSELPTKEFFSTQYDVIGKKVFTYLQNGSFFKKSFSDTRILEIGCGAGGLLLYFKEKGFQVFGVDVGAKYVEYGRSKYGLDLEVGSIESISNDRTADIIIYSHVIEHVLSPEIEFFHVKRLMNRDGYGYFEVPGVKHINMNKAYQGDFLRLLQNAHTYHFTRTTFNNLVEKNGFVMVSGDESMAAVIQQKNGGDFDRTPANDYAEVMVFLGEREIELNG